MPEQQVRVRVDLLAGGGAGAVFQALRQQTYAMAQNTARVQENMQALGGAAHLGALREQYQLQTAMTEAEQRRVRVEMTMLGTAPHLAALRAQLRLREDLARAAQRQRQAERVAQFGAAGAELLGIGDALKQAGAGVQAFGQKVAALGQVMDSSFRRGYGAITSLAAAASPDAALTLQMSWQLLAATIGREFIPVALQVAGWLQGAANWFAGLDQATKDNLVNWATWGVALLAVGKVLGPLGTVFSLTTTAFNALSSAAVWAASSFAATGASATAAAPGLAATGASAAGATPPLAAAGAAAAGVAPGLAATGAAAAVAAPGLAATGTAAVGASWGVRFLGLAIKAIPFIGLAYGIYELAQAFGLLGSNAGEAGGALQRLPRLPGFPGLTPGAAGAGAQPLATASTFRSQTLTLEGLYDQLFMESQRGDLQRQLIALQMDNNAYAQQTAAGVNVLANRPQQPPAAAPGGGWFS